MLQFRFGIVLCLAACSPAAAIAQPTTCPADSTQTYSGEVAGGASATYAIGLQPCETLTISVTTTATEPPVSYGAAARLDVYNSSGTSLYSDSWSSYPTASRTIPNTNVYTAP